MSCFILSQWVLTTYCTVSHLLPRTEPGCGQGPHLAAQPCSGLRGHTGSRAAGMQSEQKAERVRPQNSQCVGAVTGVCCPAETERSEREGAVPCCSDTLPYVMLRAWVLLLGLLLHFRQTVMTQALSRGWFWGDNSVPAWLLRLTSGQSIILSGEAQGPG